MITTLSESELEALRREYARDYINKVRTPFGNTGIPNFEEYLIETADSKWLKAQGII